MFNDEAARAWFRSFTARFGRDGLFDKALAYKIGHSERVAQYALDIAKSENWDSSADRSLCFAIGLLHDTGRFPQYEQYGTFKDADSVDHADLGADVLEREFDWNGVSSEEKEILLCSVRNHNKLVIADNVPQFALRFVNMVRDADKIDIFFQVQQRIDNGTVFDMLPRHRVYKGISQELVECIKSTGRSDYRFVKSLSDYRLAELAWGLDLNYSYSIRILKDAKIFDRIVNELKPFGIDGLCSELMNEINRRC